MKKAVNISNIIHGVMTNTIMVWTNAFMYTIVTQKYDGMIEYSDDRVKQGNQTVDGCSRGVVCGDVYSGTVPGI